MATNTKTNVLSQARALGLKWMWESMEEPIRVALSLRVRENEHDQFINTCRKYYGIDLFGVYEDLWNGLRQALHKENVKLAQQRANVEERRANVECSVCEHRNECKQMPNLKKDNMKEPAKPKAKPIVPKDVQLGKIKTVSDFLLILKGVVNHQVKWIQHLYPNGHLNSAEHFINSTIITGELGFGSDGHFRIINGTSIVRMQPMTEDMFNQLEVQVNFDGERGFTIGTFPKPVTTKR